MFHAMGRCAQAKTLANSYLFNITLDFDGTRPTGAESSAIHDG